MNIEKITTMEKWEEVDLEIYVQKLPTALLFTSKNDDWSSTIIDMIKKMEPIGGHQIIRVFNIDVDELPDAATEYHVSSDYSEHCKTSPVPVMCVFAGILGNERTDRMFGFQYITATLHKYELAIYANTHGSSSSADEDSEPACPHHPVYGGSAS